MISNYLLDKLIDILNVFSVFFMGFVLLGAAGIILAVTYALYESVKEHRKPQRKGGESDGTAQKT